MSVSAAILAVMMLGDASATAPANKAMDDENKMICRRELKTGSMVAATRRCHTKKEWARLIDATSRAAREYIELDKGVNTSN
jgi:hypothetical protein